MERIDKMGFVFFVSIFVFCLCLNVVNVVCVCIYVNTKVGELSFMDGIVFIGSS